MGLAAAFLFLGFAGCRRGDSAEQRLRTLLLQAEQAAEKKDLAALRNVISERYRDDDGNDRRSIERILRFYFLRNEAIHLFTRVSEVRVTSPGQALAVLYVAMTALPVTRAEELADRQVDLYRFDLAFADESGEWRLAQASWRRAEPGDFVYSGNR